MNNEESLNITLNPDTIMGYLVTSENYVEESEDGRRKPTFYWKAYHFYPFSVLYDDPDAEYEDGSDVYEDEDFDEDNDLVNPVVAVCTEGGSPETFNFIPMKLADMRDFVREHPSFRVADGEDLLSSLNFY